jgi:hypothetical protein
MVTGSLPRALLVLTLTASPVTAAAQTSGLGYAFGSLDFTIPGAAAVMQSGGGGEVIAGRRFGAGGEIAYLGSIPHPSSGWGVASVTATYYPRVDTAKTVHAQPFVTAGVSVFLQGGRNTFPAIGAGANWWRSPRVGFRFEVRDLILSHAFHVVGTRFGVVFR